MKKSVLLSFVAIVALQVGCSTGRTYHEWSSTWQLGYQDTALRDDLYRVSYTGYGLAPETCFDFALLRAAELTLASHVRYFDILDERQSSTSQSYQLPGITHTTGQVYAGGAFSAVSTSYVLAGSIDRPTVSLLVHLRKDLTSSSTSLDARLISDSIRKKHQLEKEEPNQ